MSVYTEEGYKSRKHYLECIAEDYGVELDTVLQIASLYGPSEDFDGLVSTLDDMQADDL